MPAGPNTTEPAPIAVIGTGAAGLMAAIAAGRTLSDAGRSDAGVIAIDSAKTLGAKILVAGGGRCNVTHDTIDHRLYAPAADHPTIRKVLRTLPVRETVAFFASLGVQLKTEPTGKLFPTTDRARTILDALLRAARDANVALRHPLRVQRVEREADTGFVIHHSGEHAAPLRARQIILATGGRSLPKTGSDGHAYTIARTLGHTITDPTFPALVPLVIDRARDTPNLTSLAGLSTIASLDVRAASGKRLHRETGSTLFTHFGLSGPAPMNVSRHFTRARLDDPRATLALNVLPGLTMDQLDTQLINARAPVGAFLRSHPNANPATPGEAASGQGLPTRLAEAICRAAHIEPKTPAHALRREQRKSLARAATEHTLPIAGDRGWNHAEVTAGGVPLAEIDPNSMRSRLDPNLYLCGEILDVDGPIGGYNFQWAWASGRLAGIAAAQAIAAEPA